MGRVISGFWVTENVLFKKEIKKLLKKLLRLLLRLKLFKKSMMLLEDLLLRSNIKVLEPWNLLFLIKLKISFFLKSIADSKLNTELLKKPMKDLT
jgi:hypothetical protein